MANPISATHKSSDIRQFSKKVYTITGLKTTVFGLDELPADITELSCLWLLHPRLGNQERMANFAYEALAEWHRKSAEKKRGKGLIAISFDQRNHGTRVTEPLANESWREKNPNHAQDMYGIYQGTAEDTSLLITHLPAYLPQTLPKLATNIVYGISLGAHAAWHNILHDKRIQAAVIIIGCPDFARLMALRASKSRLADWNSSSPPGSAFFGSASYPGALIDATEATDPAGLLLPIAAKAASLPPLQTPNASALGIVARGAKARLNKTLKGKAILNLSGGDDKLVPYACSKPVLDYLKGASDPRDGWWKEGGLLLVDKVFAGVKHETSPEMARLAAEFVGDVVEGKIPVGAGVKSRI